MPEEMAPDEAAVSMPETRLLARASSPILGLVDEAVREVAVATNTRRGLLSAHFRTMHEYFVTEVPARDSDDNEVESNLSEDMSEEDDHVSEFIDFHRFSLDLIHSTTWNVSGRMYQISLIFIDFHQI